MEQEREVQTIFFKDIIFTILRKWKVVVVATLLGALLLGGYHFYTILSTPRENAIAAGDLSSIEQINQALKDANAHIETQQVYLTTSPLMSIDPNHFYRATLALYIHTDYKIYPNTVVQDPDSMPSILAAYQQILSDGDIVTRIAEESNIPSQYLNELITCAPVVSHPGILNITIIAGDELTATTLLNSINAVMTESSTNIAKYTAKHELSPQRTVPILSADTAIADAQEAAYKRLTTLQDQKTQLQKMQTNYVISSSDSSPLLHAALGAIVGALLACAWGCICHISSKKVYSERTLKNRTGIKILGRAPSANRRSAAGKWLRKVEGRAITDQALDVIASNLRNQNLGDGNILVIGGAPEVDRETLHTALTKATVAFVDCGNLLTEPAAFDHLSACSAVLFVEKCNYSTYEDILRVMEQIADSGKPIAGCVLLDG